MVSAPIQQALFRIRADRVADGRGGHLRRSCPGDEQPHAGDWCTHGAGSQRVQHRCAGDEARSVVDRRRSRAWAGRSVARGASYGQSADRRLSVGPCRLHDRRLIIGDRRTAGLLDPSA